MTSSALPRDSQVAIIGLHCRVPGAATPEVFWRNLRGGVESITQFDDAQLLREGVSRRLVADPDYVKARGVLDDIDAFDARFFGYSPREAELMDPQHRLLLEAAWHALESCGYAIAREGCRVGVFAGCGMNTYLLNNLATDRRLIESTDYHTLLVANDKDFLATRVAYKLNLKGPAVSVATACSTSLVAVHLACQSVLGGECDVALAGGVSVPVPHRAGYLYQERGILSPDGHCRAFDAGAQGTAVGSGVAIVVVKRLVDALADDDPIHAVILGSAMNNDGGVKAGYAAPSVEGQAEVIAEAQAIAGIDPESLAYVEAHGTGTSLGDPIEIAALTNAFRAKGATRRGYCAIGSVKTNIGHLDAAAGAAGLIKAVLALRHGAIPPSLNFTRANPEIDFTRTPFFVNTALRDWPAGATPRRASVSSFGLGGTNVHMVLEEAPAAFVPSPSSRRYHPLVMSAKAEAALDSATKDLSEWLGERHTAEMADVAFTLSTARRHFDVRQIAICRQASDAAAVLRDGGLARSRLPADAPERRVAFLFPGAGAQHVQMAREIYETEPVFREALDRCRDGLQAELHVDIGDYLFPTPAAAEAAVRELERPNVGLPALFAVEYALAQVYRAWGISPAAVIGHSLGEYTAACLAGVFSLEDTLSLVARRGRLMDAVSQGAMLSVGLPEEQVRALVDDELSIAAVNSVNACAIAGTHAAVDRFASKLVARGIEIRRIPLTVASHSALVDPVLDEFGRFVDSLPRRTPKVPYISNVTGTWITAEQATDSVYWCRHLRQTVRFADGIAELLRVSPPLVLLEVGPGQVLTRLVYQHPALTKEHLVLPSMRHPLEATSDAEALLGAVGKLWLAGVRVDWGALYEGERRQRLVLPGYRFERTRYWIAPRATEGASGEAIAEGRQDEGIRPTTKGTTSQVREAARSQSILARVKGVVADLAGHPADEIADHQTFLELGLDSLALVRMNRLVKDAFDVKLAMRDVLGEVSSVAALARYVEERVAAEATPAGASLAAAPTSPPLVPAVTAAIEAASAAGVAFPGAAERVITQQLEIMRLQLEVLRGRPTGDVAQMDAGTTSIPQKEIAPAPCAPAKRRVKKPLSFAATPDASARGLTVGQQRHLDALVARYTVRTRRSKEYAARHRRVLADSRAAVGFRLALKELLYPIVGVRGVGSHIWDLDGNEYVDLTMGFGVTLFGHHPPFIVDAVRAHADEQFLLGPRSGLAGDVAQLVSELTGLERVTFCNSGTEAIMAAIRLARTATGRSLVVMFEGSYHGHSDATLAQSTLADGHFVSTPLAPGIPPDAVANTVVLEYGAEASLEFIRRQGDRIAAVLVEPVQNLHPDFQPRSFLHALRRQTTSSGIALVFDEMITGFRLHPAGAQGFFDVRADIATYGKVIGGGMPIGIVAGSAEFMDGIDGGVWRYNDASVPQAERTFFGGTFCQHPLTMVTAHAVLQELKRQGPTLQQGLNRRTSELAGTLNSYFETEELPVRMLHCGSAFRLALSGNLELLFFHLLERGVYVWEWRGCFLSTAHTESDLQHVEQAVRESFDELRRGGFVAGHPGASTKRDELDEVPLTEAQQQLWRLTQIDEQGALAYQTGLSLVLHGAVDLEALRGGVRQVVTRHEALRTLISSDGRAQRICHSGPADVEVIDFSEVPFTDRETTLAAWFERKNATPMALDRGPLFQVHLLRLDELTHILVFSAHHIVSDGWSMTNIVAEVLGSYTAARRGEAQALDAPMQFRDYVAWHERQRESGEMQDHAAYWTAHLAGPLPVLELPTDAPRPARKTYRSARETIAVDAKLAARLKQFCAARQCSLFMFLYATYHVLLHRWTGQDDLLIGISASGRSPEGSDSLVGYCTHVLPVRHRIDPHMAFLDHLFRVKATLLDAYEHQDYPFARLLDSLDLPRDVSRSPLVSVTFNLDKAVPLPTAPGLHLEMKAHPVSFSDFDLMLNVIDLNDELIVDGDYNTDLFRGTSVARLLKAYKTLLEAAITAPDEQVGRLSLVDEAERAALVAPSRGAETRAVGEPGRLHHLFEAQVAARPDAVALEYEQERVTYRDLNGRANQLARHLRELGAGPDALVGVCLSPGVDMIVALLGVLKAGGAYVPLDPSYPVDRLDFVLRDTNADVVVTAEATRALFVGRIPHVICFESDRNRLAQRSNENLEVAVTPSHLAYVIYTSGSTGQPKGVLVEHRNVARLFSATAQWFHFTERDVWTLFHSYGFDFSVWEIFGALLHGGRLVVVPYWITRNPQAFYHLLRDQRVTVLNQTPSAFRQLMNAEEALGASGDLALRLVVFGGEALDMASLTPWFARHGEAHPVLVNMYGITETTVHVTYRRVTAADAARGGSRIGAPIPDLTLHVLDHDLQPVPVGFPGEIYVGGAGVARGYLNRPELTAERFVSDRYSSRSGARLYRTGDVARLLDDGDLEYRGRLDEQVKIRGFRVELGEIGAALKSCPGIRDAAVVVRDGRGEGVERRLVAYVVPGPGVDFSVAQLRSALAQMLPDYMIPAAWVRLDALPLTANGKLDRRALPAPASDRDDTTQAYAPPRTSAEISLAKIWGDVLGRARVGVHDNFFELGGDSIVSIQIVARARDAGLTLTPRQVYERQTVAELAAAASGSSPAVPTAAAAVEAHGLVPLTPIQHWFFEQHLVEPHHYNMGLLFEVASAIDDDVLRRALACVIEHHDALRLSFDRDGAGWEQRVAVGNRVAPLETIELSTLAPGQRSSRIDTEAARLHAALRLDAPPLLRAVRFVTPRGEDDRFLLVIHHLVVDAVSWRIVVEDLQTAYEHLSQGRAVSLTPVSTSFAQYAARLPTYAASEVMTRAVASWESIATSSHVALPVDRHADMASDVIASEASISVSLTAEETERLIPPRSQAARRSVHHALLAALGHSLCRWANVDSLTVDVEGHGRDLLDDIDLSRTVGWFTTIYPVVLRAVRTTAIGAVDAVADDLRSLPQGGGGFGLLRYLSPEDDVRQRLSSIPRREVLFNYLGNLDQMFGGAALLRPSPESSGPVRGRANRRSHLLEINAFIRGGRLQVTWTYSIASHHEATIGRVARDFLDALRTCVDEEPHPASNAIDLGIDDDQVERVLAEIASEGGRLP